MPRRAVAAGWGRSQLIALLVLLLPAAAGIDADDGGLAVADLAYIDQDGVEPAADALADSGDRLPAPPVLSAAVPAAAPTPVVSVQACFPPPDRAPPRV
ncbi:MAG TPA: hypothetical protein VLK28_14785 [Methylomirabilota bacterium]|nr:hypothetical protein [Methylomirabilota bacterium]